MKKNRWLIGIGFLIAVTPVLGFPLAFKNFFLAFLGLLVAYLGFRLKEQNPRQNFEADIFMDSKKTESDDFEYSNNQEFSEGNTQKLLDDQENY